MPPYDREYTEVPSDVVSQHYVPGLDKQKIPCRVAYRYYDKGIYREDTTTCHACRVKILEAALEAERKELEQQQS